jgi:hypothetical protein
MLSNTNHTGEGSPFPGKENGTMKIYTIRKKMSNTGTIRDVESDLYDRDIEFRKGTIYAVVLAAYYGGRDAYTTHRTPEAAIRQSRSMAAYSHKIIDHEGRVYGANGNELVAVGWLRQESGT